MQTDGDRRGYVIASGDTNLEALERADAAAGLIDVLVDMSCASTSTTTASCSRPPRPAATAGRASTPSREAGDLFLRHDVDLSLEAALAMARLEHELGAHATYFLMRESVFYNLDSALGRDAIAELRDLGHAVALHAVYPRAVGRRASTPSSPGTTLTPSTCTSR